MEFMYQIGSVLYYPFSHFLIGEIAWLIAVIFMIKFAKKQNSIGKVLLWWFAGSIVLFIIFSLLPKPQYSDLPLVGMAFNALAGLAWFLYFPIISALYLSTKSQA